MAQSLKIEPFTFDCGGIAAFVAVRPGAYQRIAASLRRPAEYNKAPQAAVVWLPGVCSIVVVVEIVAIVDSRSIVDSRYSRNSRDSRKS